MTERCVHRPECEGCPWFEAYDRPRPLERALRAKHEALSQGLAWHEELRELTVEALVHASQTLGYRNRARLVVDAQAEHAGQLWGFYRRRSRQLLPITRCVVQRPALERALEALRGPLWRSPLRAICRFVEGRALHEQALLILSLDTPAPLEQPAQAELLAQAQALYEQVIERMGRARPLALGLYVSLGVRGQAVSSGELVHVAGLQAITTPLRRLEGPTVTLRLPAGAFFQLHQEQLRRAHALMGQWLGQASERTLELYCGVGVHGVALTKPGGLFYGADVSAPAIQAARELAQEAGLKAQLLSASDQDMGAWLEQALEQADPTLIVLNPARAGVRAQTLAQLSDWAWARHAPGQDGRAPGQGAPRLLYLSCEPMTLRRDLARLTRRGWRVERLAPLDMMPRTEQVEALALLRWEPPTTPRAWPQAPWQEAWGQGPDERLYSEGVSGVMEPAALGPPKRSRWRALVAGVTPPRGRLPKPPHAAGAAAIEFVRLGATDHASDLELRLEGADELELRRRLRAWGHPVLGDERFGDRRQNALFARHAYGDRVALHCTARERGELLARAKAPGIFAEWMARL